MNSIQSRVLITGASGFIGKSLLKYLACDHSVLGFGSSDLISSQHYGLDACILESARYKISQFRPTHLIHCAGLAHKSSPKRASEIINLVSSNIALTLHLASLAKEIGVKRFVYLSSIGVHGAFSLPQQSISESTQISPSSNYAQSKYLAECLLKDSLANSTCDLSVIRPSLVYGPGMPGNLRSLISAIDVGFPFPFASLNNKRSYISLYNLLSSIKLVSFHSRAAGETYVVADSETISTPDLIRSIASARRKPLCLFHFPPAILNSAIEIPYLGCKIHKLVSNFVVDSSKIRRDLVWCPPVSQAEAIRIAFSYI